MDTRETLRGMKNQNQLIRLKYNPK